ncbi:MAG: CRTAC1 family protein [Candidatus Latescibacteria bacterium]|nr:CRTAC1 family protein [Candidatus Latescibacterota bacterium]
MGWRRRVSAGWVLLGLSSYADSEVQFVDATAAAGIYFKHENGAEGRHYMPETYGAGVAFVDYDSDGFLDLYLINGGRAPGLSSAPLARNALYRNQGDGTFAEVTEQCGVGDTGYGMGVAVADYDNDSDVDIYVTNYGPNVLYRNEGMEAGYVFRDVTAQAAVGDSGWGSSAAFADVDRDGCLDLYVANYLDYPAANPLVCTVGNTQVRIYCDPRKLPGQPDRFFHNGGPQAGWVFADWTEKAGLAQSAGKELGVVFGDCDLDGDADLYLANDMAPNMLFRNDGGRFAERGLASGTSLSEDGELRAGMGVDMGDADLDGWPDLFVTNFQWQSNTLYRNLGGGFFADATRESGINRLSVPHLGFGAGFLDCDNDGDLDLFVANGHVDDNVREYDPASTYAQRNQLLMNQGDGRFVEEEHAGPGLELVEVSRGAAFGDYDNDGDTDIAITNSNSRAVLLRNDGGNSRHWLGLRLRGTHSNRDGIGARVEVVAGGRRQVCQVRSGASYLSAHDLRLLFGLGAHERAERVEIHWPSGVVQELEDIWANQYLSVEEKGSH